MFDQLTYPCKKTQKGQVEIAMYLSFYNKDIPQYYLLKIPIRALITSVRGVLGVQKVPQSPFGEVQQVNFDHQDELD